MTLEKNDKYSVITPDASSSFSEFYNAFVDGFSKFSKDNIIVNLNNVDISIEDFQVFEKISEKQIENGTSFVLINAQYNIDEFSESLIIVPSFQEAIDMIEMDEMTRDLDF